MAERPSIASIEYVGNREIKDDDIKAAVAQIGLVEGRVFDRKVLDQVISELKKQYFVLGKYGAKITDTVTPLERNRVAIKLEFNEGETAKIKQINIVGNKEFDEDDLTDEFKLSPTAVFSFFTRKDRYSRQQLQADLESLRSFYQDQGYLDFRIESTQVTISPDKKDIFVTINISEGEQYTVTDFSIEGKMIIPEDDLVPLVSISPGGIYSRRDVAASEKAISDALANEGYAFAQVNAVPDVDQESRTVSFSIFIDPGRRVYVRRINIAGNNITRDEVIRREMRQLEGGWYSAQKVQRSRVRLERLGFFDNITIETPAVPGSPDQVDVNIEVVERQTGSLLFGVGWSDADGLLFQAAITQKNLFGTGKELDLSFDNSSVTDVLRLSYLNPYHTINGVSRGFTIFRRTVDASRANTASYLTETTGAGINYRFPFSEFNSLGAGLNAERVDLETTDETPPGIREFIDENPSNDLLTLLGFGSHDTRDSVLFPTRGNIHRLNYEVTVPGSDLEFFKLSYRGVRYWPISKTFTYKIGGELGYGDGYGSTNRLPFYEHFFSGGFGSVRGFENSTLGPRTTPSEGDFFAFGDNNDPFGGNTLVEASAELIFPLPFVEDNRQFRPAFFIDAGNVFNSECLSVSTTCFDLDLDQLRYSVGFGLTWLTGLGPMTFSVAKPFQTEDFDEEERFQFELGRTF